MLSKLWVPHDVDVFELVDVVCENDVTGEVTVCSVKDGSTRVVSKADAKIADETHLQDVDDLCSMNNLHEAPMLYNLHARFEIDKIYTNTGNILISVNPYKHIGGLYDAPLRFFRLFDDEDDDDNQTFVPPSDSNIPHVYVTANSALRILASSSVDESTGLLSSSKRLSLNRITNVCVNQSIIVSGESGAGKTEAAKHVMNFLIVANDFMCGQGSKAKSNSNLLEIGEKIKSVLMQSNVVLEAFGNAKTVQNDNSSRFGKYIRLQYTADNQLCSAYTETFLLEKSRLVSLGSGERNYHIFYQLIRGLSGRNPSLAMELKLKGVEDFSMLTEGNCVDVGGPQHDEINFEELCSALQVLGCTDAEIRSLWCVLAALLHLGEVQVVPDVKDPENARCTLVGGQLSISEISASLLGVVPEELTASITTHQMQAGRRGSVHIKVLSQMDTKNNICGLIKWLYRSLFSWLIRKVNFVHSTVACGVDGSPPRPVVKFIGILDIFGFEILGVNSFEQLCINYTNERLQAQFNSHVFVLEQKDYVKEGLAVSCVEFRDNQHVIDLIAKKPSGLLLVLEEHGMMNRKPDDLALLAAYNQLHEKSAAFSKSRFAGSSFIVKHFAGDVTYCIEGFLNKNNNCLQDDLQAVINRSENLFVQEIIGSLNTFQGNESGDGTAVTKKKMASADSVSFHFRNQLDQLVSTLQSTHPHYIKAIKANTLKRAGIFESPLVLKQLRYSGALEVVRIRKEGFPTRMLYSAFYNEMWPLRENSWCLPGVCSDELARSYSLALAEKYLRPGNFQGGSSMIFLSDGSLFVFHRAILSLMVLAAIRLQGWYRCLACCSRFSRSKKSALVMQRFVRKALRMCRALREAARRRKIRIQKEQEERERREREELEMRLKLEREAAELRERLEKEEAERRAAAELLRIQQEQQQREAEERQALAEMLERERVQREWEALRQKEVEMMIVKRQECARVLLTKVLSKYSTRRRQQALIERIHLACKDARDADAVNLLNSNPELILLSFRRETLFRAACVGGCTKTLNVLCKHGLRSRILTSNFLKEAWSGSFVPALTQILSALNEQQNCVAAGDNAADLVSSAVADLQLWQERINGTSGKVLFAGLLEKKRGKNEWKSRFCVCTSSEILYFVKSDDEIPKGTVPLEKCTIRRSLEGLNVFEILAPNIVAKRTIFGTEKAKSMLFRASSANECNMWLYVLRAITGSIGSVGTLVKGHLLNSNALLQLVESGDKYAPSEPSQVETLADMSAAFACCWLQHCRLSLNDPFWGDINSTEAGVLRPPRLQGYSFVRLTLLLQTGVSSQEMNHSMSLQLELAQDPPKLLSLPHTFVDPKYVLPVAGSVLWMASTTLDIPFENMEEAARIVLMYSAGGEVSTASLARASLVPGFVSFKFGQSELNVLIQFIQKS